MCLSNNIKIIKFGPKAFSIFLLFCLFYMVASASHYGFFGKWGLRGDNSRFGVVHMIDGTAHKPFVYRQLGPIIAKTISSITPEPIKTKTVNLFSFHKMFSANVIVATERTGYDFSSILLYFYSFTGLLLTLYVYRLLLLDLGVSKIAATCSPVILVLAFPYLETVGGYFYDSVELASFGLALYASRKGWITFLLVLTILATLNKESFFFFVPTLLPFLLDKFSLKKAIAIIWAMIIIAGLVNLAIKYIYADNYGGVAEFHLIANLSYYINPFNYFSLGNTYGVLSPEKNSLFTILALAIPSIRGWHSSDAIMKKHFFIALLINFPLFIVFCYQGELRNLSMLIPSIIYLIGCYIHDLSYIEREAKKLTCDND